MRRMRRYEKFGGINMSGWSYRKVGPSELKENCVVCGKKQQQRKSGTTKYHPYCSSCRKELYGGGDTKGQQKRREEKKRPYIIHKKDSCESCGFLPTHSCQLDVDHIDGDHHNNDPNNLQTLCSNCHRLKTYLAKDWEPVD